VTASDVRLDGVRPAQPVRVVFVDASGG
jgi:hypothetical protein